MRKSLVILVLLALVVLVSGCTPRDLGLLDAGGKPRISSSDYLYDIAEGYIEGHKPWHVYGYNPGVGLTDEAVWEYSGAYTFPAAPGRMELVSSSAQDGVGGTGALTVKIYYLDDNYMEQEEIVTMAGIAAAPTVATNIFRINGTVVQTTGTGLAAAGNIQLQAFGGGTIYNYLLAGRNTAKALIYTVPANHTLYIVEGVYSTSDAAKGVRMTLKANYDYGNNGGMLVDHFISYTELISYNTGLVVPYSMPLRFPAMTDIKAVVRSGQAGAEAVVTLRGWVENELEDED